MKVKLFPHRRTGFHTEENKQNQRKRTSISGIVLQWQQYMPCKILFHAWHKVENIACYCTIIRQDGLSARVHGSVAKPNENALNYNDRQKIKNFLCKYATDNGFPLPGRLPNFKNYNVLLMPSDKNGADIHSIYKTVAKDMKYSSISLRTFQGT